MSQGNGSSTSSISGERLDQLTATHVTLSKSAARKVEATQASLDRSPVQNLHAEQAELTQSPVMLARMEQGTLRQSTAGVVVAKSVACDQVRTGVLISPVVRGEVHTWLDMRSAVAIGFGMVLGKLAIALVRGAARRALR